MHPDKTRLLDFMSPNHSDRHRKDDGDDDGKPQPAWLYALLGQVSKG